MAIIRGNTVSFSSALRLGHNPRNNQQWWFIYNQGCPRGSLQKLNLGPGARVGTQNGVISVGSPLRCDNIVTILLQHV